MNPASRARRAAHPALIPAACAAVALGATAFVSQVNPNQPGHYPICPFYALTGYYCPLCGSLRAVYALTHGDLGQALHDNALTITALPLLAGLWAWWLVGTLRPRPRGEPRHRSTQLVAIWLSTAVIAAFWLVRNLPVGHALAPLGH